MIERRMAAAARTTDAPLVARAFKPSFSSSVQIDLVRLGTCSSCYFGALSSLCCQPALSDLIESVATVNVVTWSHFSHSKLRKSYPLGPGMIRARFMRSWHLGQCGRSIGISDGPVQWEYEMVM
jgi:hypothetical protein